MTVSVRLAGIVPESIVDGPGIRFAIFFQGCQHNCQGCHNPQTHPLSGGSVTTFDFIMNELHKHRIVCGVTISGGEPFLQPNELSDLILRIKNETSLEILVYTGYKIGELKENLIYSKILKEIDYLVDGRFINEERDLELLYRGSSNQRFIDVKTNRVLDESEISLL